MGRVDRYGNAGREILKITGPGVPMVKEIEFEELYSKMVNTEIQYRPSQGVVDEIISSGKLDLFENEKLKNHLSSWSGVLLKIRFQEQELSKVRYDLVDLSQKFGNTRNLFVHLDSTVLQTNESKFKSSNLTLLQNQEFENNVAAYVATTKFANQYYYPNVQEKIDVILELIDEEIE